MSKQIRSVLFGLVVLAQIAVPASLVYSRESILSQGEKVLFRTQPVDPYDAFRGRYLWLGFEEDQVPASIEDRWEYGQVGYVIVEKDSAGFAKARSVVRHKPGKGIYVKALVQSVLHKGKVQVQYPFAQFFISEEKAPKAESIYREHTNQ